MEKIDENILKQIEQITNSKYNPDANINDLFTDLLFEIEKRDDIISDKNNKIAELESGEDFSDSRYEYGY